MKKINYLGETIVVDNEDKRVTIVSLSDFTVGISRLDKGDKFNEAIGIYIAYYKAKIKQARRIESWNQKIVNEYKDKIRPFYAEDIK